MDIIELSRQKGTKRHPWELARLSIIKHFINKYHPKCFHVLDVGSGDAYIINSLQQEGLGKKFTAIDTAYTPQIIQQVQLNKHGTIEFLNKLPYYPTFQADCILLLDVLEHCSDDASVLRSLKDFYSKESTLIITVPAFQFLFSNHDKELGHYRRYSIAQLEKLCIQNGYALINSGYFFFSLLLVRAVSLVFQKIETQKIKKTVDNWKGGVFVTRAIYVFLWIDFLLSRILNKLSIKLPGLSAFCICRPLP